jgi:hypothetical protein
VHQAYFSIDKAIIFVDKYNFPVQLRYKSCTKKLYEMNKLKSIFRLSALCLILSAGLLACKSSKKMADSSNTDATEEQQEKPDDTTVDAEVNESNKSDKVEVDIESISSRLDDYFDAIANSANNTAKANGNINEAKAMFASPDVPVLIVIHQSGDGRKDYDEPTTILDYMNYLKDQGKNLNDIYEVKTNDKGRISELVLIRK